MKNPEFAVMIQSTQVIVFAIFTNIQIKIAMSKDKLRILIKILAESHMAFDLGDKIDIRCTQTDRPALFSTSPVGMVRTVLLLWS